MGVWEGIFKGSEAADARKERDKDFALKTKIFDENKRMGRLDSLSKYVSTYQKESGGSSFTGTGKKVASLQGADHYINILSDMGIDPDAIARVAGTGARNLQSVTKLLSDAQTKHISEYGTDVEPPLAQYNLALANAVLTQPSGPTIDMDKVSKMFGIELSEYELAMITPGAPAPDFTIRPGDLNIVENLDITKLPKIIEAAGINLVATATQQIKKIQEASMEPGDDEASRAINVFLTGRIGEIQSALGVAQGNSKNHVPLISLFGNKFMNTIINSDPSYAKAAKMDKIPRAYTQASEGSIIDVSTNEYGPQILTYLKEKNLLPIGTRLKVSVQGQIVDEVYTGG